MWVMTQRQNAQLKIHRRRARLRMQTLLTWYLDSVTAGLDYFKVGSIVNAIPFIPLKDLAVEMITASKIFQRIHRVWNQDGNLYHANHETQTRMKNAIFDKNIVGRVASQAWDIFDITGPISQPNNAVKFMKTVAGLTLIHTRLFLFQRDQVKNTSSISIDPEKGIRGAGLPKILPLTSQQVNEVIHGFQKSLERKYLCIHIDGNLAKFGLNMMKGFSIVKVESIIREAIKVALLSGNS
jgi:hypothetical protein